jgi:hypothetical protein
LNRLVCAGQILGSEIVEQCRPQFHIEWRRHLERSHEPRSFLRIVEHERIPCEGRQVIRLNTIIGNMAAFRDACDCECRGSHELTEARTCQDCPFVQSPDRSLPMNEQVSPLRQRMIDDMTIRNMSPLTQDAYIRAVRRFSLFFRRSPDKLTFEHVREYQLHLASRGLSTPIQCCERRRAGRCLP